MESFGVLLPTNETAYGEISADELSEFLAFSRDAMKSNGLLFVETKYPKTDRAVELWGVGQIKVISESVFELSIIDSKENYVDLCVDWLDLIGCTKYGIESAIENAIALFKGEEEN